MKGFIFSLDSLISIGLILLAATTLWATISETTITDNTSEKLYNSQITTLYFNENEKLSIQTNQIQKCEELSYYDSNITKTTLIPTISQKTICEGTI